MISSGPDSLPRPGRKRLSTLEAKDISKFTSGLLDFAQTVGGDRARCALLISAAIRDRQTLTIKELAATCGGIICLANFPYSSHEVRDGLPALLKSALPEGDAYTWFAEQTVTAVQDLRPVRAQAVPSTPAELPPPPHAACLKRLAGMALTMNIQNLLDSTRWNSPGELLRYLAALRKEGVPEEFADTLRMSLRDLAKVTLETGMESIKESLSPRQRTSALKAVSSVCESLERWEQAHRFQGAKKEVGALGQKLANPNEKRIANDMKFATNLFAAELPKPS